MDRLISLIVVFAFSNVLPSTGLFLNNTNVGNVRNSKDLCIKSTDVFAEDIWSPVLEKWTLREDENVRKAKLVSPSTQKSTPRSGFYITTNMNNQNNDMEMEASYNNNNNNHDNHNNNNDNNNYYNNNNNNNNNVESLGGYRQNFDQNNILQSPMREVTGTDLYLLGAIEKLVYRVDSLEKRLSRAEKFVYYFLENKTPDEKDPCPDDFTMIPKVNGQCYHVGVSRDLNWKSAITICKSLGAHIIEIETEVEKQELLKYIGNNESLNGRDFWIGGINPGLLWIWSNTARPVNPFTNATSTSETTANKGAGSNTTASISYEKFNIKGTGRCLKLTFNAQTKSYEYTGHDCSSRHSYLCEMKDSHLDNEISRIARQLNIEN